MSELSPKAEAKDMELVSMKSVLIAVRVHPFPSRTRQLSSLAPKILGWRRPGKIGSADTKEMDSRKAVHLLFVLNAKSGGFPAASCCWRGTSVPDASACVSPAEGRASSPALPSGAPWNPPCAASYFARAEAGGPPGLWCPCLRAGRPSEPPVAGALDWG